MKPNLPYKFFIAITLMTLSFSGCKPKSSIDEDTYTKSANAKFKLTEGEEKLLDVYGIRELYNDLKKSDSQEILERFLYAADSIHQISFSTIKKVGSADQDTTVKGLAQAYQTYRTEFFRIEALIRLYRKVDDYEKFMEPLYTNESKSGLRPNFGIKQMEDGLGQYGEKAMNLKFSQSVNASPQVLSFQSTNLQKSYSILSQLIITDWLPNAQGQVPYLTRLFSQLSKNKKDLLTNEADNSKIVKILTRELEEFDSKELDFEDLEEGYHELRRNLRWIPILIVSFDGLIYPDATAGNSGVPDYEATMSLPSVTEGKYFQALQLMRRPKGYKRFPISLYAASSYYAEQIGYIKDILQNYHALISAYKNSGLSDIDATSTAKKLLLDHGYKEVDYSPALVKDLATTKPLILMKFAPHGRDISRLVKGKETGIFKKITKFLKK